MCALNLVEDLAHVCVHLILRLINFSGRGEKTAWVTWGSLFFSEVSDALIELLGIATNLGINVIAEWFVHGADVKAWK